MRTLLPESDGRDERQIALRITTPMVIAKHGFAGEER